MNSLIVTTNFWASRTLAFAWPMLWQSSVLIALLFVLDVALRKKVRAAVRYGLWMVVLVKLVLPPSFAFPSGVCWWLRPSAPNPALHREAQRVVAYRPAPTKRLVELTAPSTMPSSGPTLSVEASCLLLWSCVTLTLLGWMVVRSRQVAQQAQAASPSPDWLRELLEKTGVSAGVRRPVRLKVRDGYESPAVCGLLRPIILVPRALVEQLTAVQLRAVLLHELVHVRRADAWVSCGQAVLQVVYWWHPLLWVANARIRRVREEAVDDAVMLRLQADAGTYVPTLVEVAKLALNRPLLNLALVGIFESQSTLRLRIERLIDFRPPRKTGLTVGSLICVIGLAALALPMGEAPPKRSTASGITNPNQGGWPDARFQGYREVRLEPRFLIADETAIRAVLPSLVDQQEPLLFSSNQVAELDSRLQQAQTQPFSSAESLSFAKFSGGIFHWSIGGATNNGVNYLTRNAGEKTIVTGAEVDFSSSQPDWVPLELTVVPWAADEGVRCQLRMAFADNPHSAQVADVIIPLGGAAVWAGLAAPNARIYELVVLREQSGATNEADFSKSNTKLGRSNDNRALGFDWYLGNSLMANNSAPIHSGSAPSFLGVPTNNSSRLEYDAAIGMIRATNGALVNYDQTIWRADRMTGVVSNHQLAEVIAEGNVRLQQPQQVWIGDRLRIIFPNSTNGGATILNDSAPARGKSGQSQNAPAEDTTTRYDLGQLSHVFPPPVENPEAKAAEPLYTRYIKIDLDATFQIAGGALNARTKASMAQSLRDFFTSVGVDLKPPKSMFYKETNKALLVRATRSDLDVIEHALARLRALEPSTQSSRAPDEARQLGSTGAIPAEAANANTARNKAYHYLDQTRIQTVLFDNSPLREVVDNLTEWAKKANLGRDTIAFTYQREPEDLGEVRITIRPALTDVRLADIIDAICEVSPIPLKYSITETGVEFGRKVKDPVVLYTRIIRVDSEAFVRNLSAAIGARGDVTIGQVQIGDFFSLYGVHFEPPKTIFFNDREGYLTVRAGLEELDKVERAIIDLNGDPAQINIKANFVTLPETVAKTLCNSLGLTNVVSDDRRTVSTMVTSAQCAVLLKALDSADGADDLSAASVTTLSGRQAQIQIVDLNTAVTNQSPQALTATGISPPPGGTTNLHRPTTIPFGPTMDVVGWVSPDATSIELVVNVTYVGYDNLPGSALGRSPRVWSGQASGTVFVQEGQTLLLQTVLSDESATAAAAIPELLNKRLLVFLTPRILSPSKNSKRGEFESPEPPPR
jgi:beta-lactamase regulating signal transducer with metallopeptidase domain